MLGVGGTGLCASEGWPGGAVDDVVALRFAFAGAFAGVYLSADVGWRTKFISFVPSADQRSTVTRKKEQSTSLVLSEPWPHSSIHNLLNIDQ